MIARAPATRTAQAGAGGGAGDDAGWQEESRRRGRRQLGDAASKWRAQRRRGRGPRSGLGPTVAWCSSASTAWTRRGRVLAARAWGLLSIVSTWVAGSIYIRREPVWSTLDAGPPHPPRPVAPDLTRRSGGAGPAGRGRRQHASGGAAGAAFAAIAAISDQHDPVLLPFRRDEENYYELTSVATVFEVEAAPGRGDGHRAFQEAVGRSGVARLTSCCSGPCSRACREQKAAA